MKIFEFIQLNSSFFGIGLHQHPFNVRNLVAIFTFGVAITLNVVYIFGEAKTFQQYTDSIFAATTLCLGFIIFAHNTSKMQRIFHRIKAGEKLMNRSRFSFFLLHIELLGQKWILNNIFLLFFK